MKTLLASAATPALTVAATLALIACPAYAQLQLKAPGQTEPVYASESIFEGANKDTPVEFEFSQLLGKPWRFIFTGIEAYADCDNVPGSYAWDGRMRLHPKEEGQGSDAVVNGTWKFWGSVNGITVGPIEFTTSALDDAGSGPQQMWLPAARVFTGNDLTATWTGQGNTRDPDGYWEILGSVIPEAPAPTGSLTFAQSHYPEGNSPPFRWNVNRSSDDIESDGGKDNRGHGNNVDGFDRDNPGNAPFVDRSPTDEPDDEAAPGEERAPPSETNTAKDGSGNNE